MNTALRNRPPRIARKISIDDFMGAEPPDDQRSGLYALLEIYPYEAIGDGENHGDLVDVVMVGWGDVFMSRAKDYQNRHAAALAEWQAWDINHDEFSERHSKKLVELNVKYDLASELCDETRFKIVEVLKA